MKREPRTDLLSWDELAASLDSPSIRRLFRYADLDAPVELATKAIRMAAAWLESTLEVEAEQLWDGSRTFADLAAGPLCLPAVFKSQYRPLELQLMSDLAVDVGEMLVESRAPWVTAEEFVANAIFDLAHAEVGEFETEGVIRDAKLAKRVHAQLDTIQFETLGCSDAVPLLMGTSESLQRDLALEIEPREIIGEWFDQDF